MHELLNLANNIHQLSGFEFSNLTVLVGVLVSTTILRLTGINPGGILAAAFMILAAVSSLWWALALPPVSVAIAWLYKRFFSHIYVGRQPLFIMAGMSVIIMTFVGLLMQHYHLIIVADYTYPLGIILPAIMASAIIKQGLSQTFSYAAIATAITAIVLTVIYVAGRALGHDFHAIDRIIEQREALHVVLGTAQALLSIVIGFTIYKLRNVKSAGYIMLPFLATLCIISPQNFALLIGLAIVAYTVTVLMRRYSLLLGVSRYTFVLVLSVTLVWTVEYIILHTTGHFSPFMGTNVFAALAIAVLVNEHSLYGARRAAPLFALSMVIMVALELGGSYTVEALALHHPPTAQEWQPVLSRRE